MKDDELLDLVDEKDKIIGEVWKSKAHKDPSLIHREVAIAVFSRKSEVLLAQRSMNKVNSPGEWKMTAAGHIEKGERAKVAVRRETYEELGIHIEPIYFKKVFNKYKDLESRFIWLYYTIVEEKLKLNLNKEEVINAKWVKVEALEKFSKKNDYSLKGVSHKTIMEMKEHLNL